jgi:hypothetical protein
VRTQVSKEFPVIRAHLIGGQRDRRVFNLLSLVARVLSPVDGPYFEYRLVPMPESTPGMWPRHHHIYVDVALTDLQAQAAVSEYLVEWAAAHDG